MYVHTQNILENMQKLYVFQVHTNVAKKIRPRRICIFQLDYIYSFNEFNL